MLCCRSFYNAGHRATQRRSLMLMDWVCRGERKEAAKPDSRSRKPQERGVGSGRGPPIVGPRTCVSSGAALPSHRNAADRSTARGNAFDSDPPQRLGLTKGLGRNVRKD